MSRIDQLIAELCPNGVSFKHLKVNYTPFSRPSIKRECFMSKSISKEIKQKVLEYFQQGNSFKITARFLDLKPYTVRNWYYLYRAGDYSWVNLKQVKTDKVKLEKAIKEYLNTNQGFGILAQKYGISSSTLLHAKQNFVNFGVVSLPRGRKTMKHLQEQKQLLKEKLQSVSEDDRPLSSKELKEMRDLIIVNISLLEVLEESHPEELKKKEFRQQIKQLKKRLACVEHVLYCK